MALVEPLHEDPMSWTLGDRIYKAMRVADLTAKDLSQQYKEKGLVVSRQRIGRWLDDERDPSATELVVLSEITGVDREWLLALRSMTCCLRPTGSTRPTCTPSAATCSPSSRSSPFAPQRTVNLAHPVRRSPCRYSKSTRGRGIGDARQVRAVGTPKEPRAEHGT